MINYHSFLRAESQRAEDYARRKRKCHSYAVY